MTETMTWDDHYDDRITGPAGDLQGMLVWAPGAEEIIRKLGADPQRVLDHAQEGAYEGIKDALRPAFYEFCEENGIKQD